MKYFIVNVNNCLQLSHYEPFFYEHQYRGELVMLEEIEDTCQLKKTYHELVAYQNRRPEKDQQYVVLVFIPRDFGLPLRPQDYELYNDINTYMHLLLKLSDRFKVYTFYMDRTGEMEENDAAYQKLSAVYASLQAEYPELRPYFPTLDDREGKTGDYREYLQQRIEQLSPCTQSFYQQMLKTAPETPATDVGFQNGINLYVGEAKRVLSEVKHMYASVYRMVVAQEIEEWLKVVYYIKDMLKEQKLPEEMPAFGDYIFTQAENAQRLLATYRRRLSLWHSRPGKVPTKGLCQKWDFQEPEKASANYKTRTSEKIERELKGQKLGEIGTRDAVDKIFERLNKLVTDAWRDLRSETEKQSKALVNPESYIRRDQEAFDLDAQEETPNPEETELLEKLNKHEVATAAMPDFSAENRLEQELEVINHQINQILENLSEYCVKTFLITLASALVVIAGLYVGAQYSIFLQENTWWIYGLYLLVSGGIFSGAYLQVRTKYGKEIAALVRQCRTKVEEFLKSFMQIAEDFEKNVTAAGKYRCLKMQLDEKAEARKQYTETMQKFAWHRQKVRQILQNLEYFDSFIGNAAPFEESEMALESFDQDPVHTEFYHLKVFRS